MPPFLREVVFATWTLPLFIWHIRHAARTSTRLSIALSLISAAFFTYLLLNVVPVEIELSTITGLPAISSLLKNLLYGFAAAGCIATWRVTYPAKALERTAWLVVAAYSLFTVVAWHRLTDLCPYAVGLRFDLCAFTHVLGAATEVSGLAVVAAAAVITAVLFSPAAGGRTRSARAMSVLIAAIACSVIWAIVAAIGVIEVYRNGQLSSFQYQVRGPLAVSSALLLISAVLYVPAARAVMGMAFSFRCRRLRSVLHLNRKDIGPAWSPEDEQITNMMDAVGDHLSARGIEVRQVDNAQVSESVDIMSAILANRRHEDIVHAPVRDHYSEQKSWLLGIDRQLRLLQMEPA